MTTDVSNFDLQWSDVHFVSFLFYHYCRYISSKSIKHCTVCLQNKCKIMLKLKSVQNFLLFKLMSAETSRKISYTSTYYIINYSSRHYFNYELGQKYCQWFDFKVGHSNFDNGPKNRSHFFPYLKIRFL